MKVTLISFTANPIETIYTLWEQSKTYGPLEYIIRDAYANGDAGELFRAVLDQEIPVAEAITFNFVCEDVPIAWREQAVRHRIGVSYGDNFSVDVIPDADMSFWSQSHRLKNMETFADDREYHTPASIAESAPATALYDRAMAQIQDAYAALVSCGIPFEDARNLLPLGATHRIAMTVNLRALKHIIGKRGCWILQAGLWGPVIRDIVNELAAKVDPAFRSLAYPPCISQGRFTECKFKVENERRVSGADDMPICPLYWTSEHAGKMLRGDAGARVEARIPQYAALWDQPDLIKTWTWEEKS